MDKLQNLELMAELETKTAWLSLLTSPMVFLLWAISIAMAAFLIPLPCPCNQRVVRTGFIYAMTIWPLSLSRIFM